MQGFVVQGGGNKVLFILVWEACKVLAWLRDPNIKEVLGEYIYIYIYIKGHPSESV